MFLAIQSLLPTTCPTAWQALLTNRIIRDNRPQTPRKWGSGNLHPLVLMLSHCIFDRMCILKPTQRVGTAAEWKAIYIPMADADPSALASPRFAFSDQGVPRAPSARSILQRCHTVTMISRSRRTRLKTRNSATFSLDGRLKDAIMLRSPLFTLKPWDSSGNRVSNPTIEGATNLHPQPIAPPTASSSDRKVLDTKRSPN
jgi:hypothetical protein